MPVQQFNYLSVFAHRIQSLDFSHVYQIGKATDNQMYVLRQIVSEKGDRSVNRLGLD